MTNPNKILHWNYKWHVTLELQVTRDTDSNDDVTLELQVTRDTDSNDDVTLKLT